jgi:hypothetical protein
MNTSAIVGYQFTIVYANSPPGTPPTVITVTAGPLSALLPDLTGLHGSIQVAALDASGDAGVASALVTF